MPVDLTTEQRSWLDMLTQMARLSITVRVDDILIEFSAQYHTQPLMVHILSYIAQRIPDRSIVFTLSE